MINPSTLPPAAKNKPDFLSLLRSDLPASFVVFLIAVPLSLGIALASGAPSVVAGLIAAVVGGIVVGLMGGAPLQVSGPAAGLTVVVFGLVHQFGWATTCAITACAGLVQILLGSLRISRAALYISPSVVHGMLAGIGIVIALAQLHVVLGGQPQASALLNLKALPQQIVEHHGPAVILGLITIAVLAAWPLLPKIVQKVPAALAAVSLSTLVSLLYAMDVKRVHLPDNLYTDHVLPALPTGNWGAFGIAVATVALIASVESLLAAVATDKLHSGDRANLDRELLGQGAGNLVSGLLGGLPITGVVVRSSANIKAGAKSRLSSILHGFWILLFVTLLGVVIQKIPLASLAGLLVFVGIKLVDFHHIRELGIHREAPIYFVTVTGVVFLNLLAGVGLGIGLALLMLLRRLAQATITIKQGAGLPLGEHVRQHVRMEGSLTFLSVPQITAQLSTIPPGANVEIDLAVDLMDHAAFESLHSWRIAHEKTGGRVDIDERHEGWYDSALSGKPRTTRLAPIATLNALFFGRSRRKVTAPSVPASIAEDSAAAPAGLPANDSLLEGMRTFARDSAPVVRPLLEQLAREGQEPTELFITCADSRIVPSLITSSGPGDLFVVRNVGNLIPPLPLQNGETVSGGGDVSVSAALDYSLHVLNVNRVVVCGHSGCGAMNALVEGKIAGTDTPLGNWLAHGQKSMERFLLGETMDGARTEADRLSQINVVQQLETLRTFPTVREREKDGSLQLVGLFFDIEEARVLIYDPILHRFVPVDGDGPAPPDETRPARDKENILVGAR